MTAQLADYSQTLYNLINDPNARIKAQATLSKPFDNALEYNILSLPKLAKQIIICLREKDPAYWSLVLLDTSLTTLAAAGFGVPLEENPNALLIETGVFRGCILQKADALFLGSRQLTPRTLMIHSLSAARDKSILGVV